jgi:Sigma-70, region 4
MAVLRILFNFATRMRKAKANPMTGVRFLPEHNLHMRVVSWEEEATYLRPPLRVVFVLRDIEGFSAEETARLLGLSNIAVKTRLRRARLGLRKKQSVWFEDRSGRTTRQGRSESVVLRLCPKTRERLEVIHGN